MAALQQNFGQEGLKAQDLPILYGLRKLQPSSLYHNINTFKNLSIYRYLYGQSTKAQIQLAPTPGAVLIFSS